MNLRISVNSSVVAGDVRWLPAGSTVTLAHSARDRQDWGSILSALAIAIGRGVNVVWESARADDPSSPRAIREEGK